MVKYFGSSVTAFFELHYHILIIEIHKQSLFSTKGNIFSNYYIRVKSLVQLHATIFTEIDSAVMLFFPLSCVELRSLRDMAKDGPMRHCTIDNDFVIEI